MLRYGLSIDQVALTQDIVSSLRGVERVHFCTKNFGVLEFLIGRRAHEGDRACGAIAERMCLDIEAWRRGLLVVDAEVKCGDRARPIKRELDGHAAALVEHGGDDAAVKNARLGIADEDGTVGQT